MSSDGTQAPEPPRAYLDPVAGFSGGRGQQEAETRPGRDDVTGFEVAEPVQPDQDAVRDMVNAALAEEERTKEGEGGAGEQQQVVATPPQQRGGPPERSWRAPAQLVPQMLRRRRPPRRQRDSELAGSPWRRPSKGSAGVAVAVVLTLLFVVVAIQFLSSLFESISSIFQ